MNYTAKLNGRGYTLPKFTTNIEKSVKSVTQAARDYDSDIIDVDVFLQAEVDFLKLILGETKATELVGSCDLEELDIREVDGYCCEIVSTYTKPLIEARAKLAQEQCAPYQKMLNDVGVKNAMSAMNR